MYKNSDYWDAEDICFEYEHIEKVLEVIKANFDDYFEFNKEASLIVLKSNVTKEMV